MLIEKINLIEAILHEARVKNISQKELSIRSGMPEPSISRIKRKNTVSVLALEKLANAVGLVLTLAPQQADMNELAPGWSSETGWFEKNACEKTVVTWPTGFSDDEFRISKRPADTTE